MEGNIREKVYYLKQFIYHASIQNTMSFGNQDHDIN